MGYLQTEAKPDSERQVFFDPAVSGNKPKATRPAGRSREKDLPATCLRRNDETDETSSPAQ
jgi:hypothetical protein